MLKAPVKMWRQTSSKTSGGWLAASWPPGTHWGAAGIKAKAIPDIFQTSLADILPLAPTSHLRLGQPLLKPGSAQSQGGPSILQ